MKRNVKSILYVVLIAGTVFFGLRFRVGFNRAVEVPPVDSPTNQTPATSMETASRPSSKRVGEMMTAGALGLISLFGLGILAARDVAYFFAHRMQTFVFDEDLAGERDPQYEEAEKVWANGKHLEAVQLMREYLQEHPREQYVALRIAEIYEKDLGNYVAATLEYEEILRKHLPPERWGWAAIHLANLYSGKLNKTVEATALLRRIIEEHPTTAAAKKARERLGEPEPIPEAEPEPIPEAEPQPQPPFEQPQPPASNLPPGFRPK